MDRLLIAFIRQRMNGSANVDLGELIDAAERYFGKVEPREFFGALKLVLRDRRFWRTRFSDSEDNSHNR